jgi:quercetin dioxygenase-like cupin family protein
MNTTSPICTPIARRLLLAACIAEVAASGGLLAQDGRATIRPGDVPWPAAGAGGTGTSGAAGIQTVVLKGDPAKAGLYTLMLRVAPNVRIQAHSHRDDRVATVLKGTWYFGYGDRFDEAALKALEPGSFYTEPPGVAHFAMTKEEVILQIVGTGPSSTTYVDAANDPARR